MDQAELGHAGCGAALTFVPLASCLPNLDLLTLMTASYGLDLFLLSIDEGITGYRDDSLETVKRNEQTYGIPLVRSKHSINECT